MKSSAQAIFIDTSIAIARRVHSPSTRSLIEARLREFDIVATSSVVKQEFKRRLLKEAKYLLGVLSQYDSLKQAIRHVQEVLPPQSLRKKEICLKTLYAIWEGAEEEDEKSLHDRACSYLRLLLVTGMQGFQEDVDTIVAGARCACAEHPVRELVPYERYRLGPERCSKLASTCGVQAFANDHREQATRILKLLNSLPAESKSRQLVHAESALQSHLDGGVDFISLEPCLKLGDLVIALESSGIAVFYTMNGKDSQHLARALCQDLVVRFPNWHRPEEHCKATDSSWREF